MNYGLLNDLRPANLLLSAMALDNREVENSKRFISAEDLTVDSGYKDFLGKGAFGKVFRCYHQDKPTAVAVKMFDITGSRHVVDTTWKLVEREMHMLEYLQESPRVVDLVGVTRIDECMLGLIMEYLPRGNLSDLVAKTAIPWTLVGRMMLETASGLSFLHRVKFDIRMTHNDLKPENILFDEHFHVKLCDFGGSNLAVHTTAKPSRNQSNTSNVYSINYVAPEYLIDVNSTRTRAMDVYSYGMILFFVLSRKPAFHNYDSATITYFLTTGVRPKLDEESIISSAQSNEEKELVKMLFFQLTRCSDFEPKNRPRIHSVESELKSTVVQFDEAAFELIERSLAKEIPMLEEGVCENRVGLQEKCRTIFVKKLQIPFDAAFSEGDKIRPFYPSELKPFFQRDENELKAFDRSGDSESGSFNQTGNRIINIKATSSSSEIAFRPPVDNGNEPKNTTVKVRGRCSPSTNVITIDVDGDGLRKGDNFIIQSNNKLLSCLVVDAYKKEDI